MTDWSTPRPTALPLFVHPSHVFGNGIQAKFVGSGGGTPSARTWTAKLVQYTPILLPHPYPVKRVWWINGSTIAASNVDFGIYSRDGTRIYRTGSVAMVGASAVQYVTPSPDFILDAGYYWLAWTCDNTTARGQAWSGSAQSGRLAGMLQETTALFGLPATMTPVAWAQAWGPSVCGLTRTASGF